MLYEGQIVHNTYQVVNEIGSGGMGVIYLAYHLHLEKYIVMKKIKGHHSDLTLIRNEVDILKELHHPYLPQVYDFFEYDCEIYTVIDYINGYDLNHYINSGYQFTESQLIKWLKQLCDVLNYLHTHNPCVLHTDIKPANIIVTESGDICLIDFGISLHSNDIVKGHSEFYASPEQYMNVYNIINGYSDHLVDLDARTDIYSLGATFYHMMTGVRPVVMKENMFLLSQYDLEYSDELIKIIDKAMSLDRTKRFDSTRSMLKAIDNMKKQDYRYRRYLMIQILSSVLASVFIVSGFMLMYGGYKNLCIDEYQKEYAEFIRAVDIGDINQAINIGRSIISNSKYDFVMDEISESQMLYSLGLCFYEDANYQEAIIYYKKAIDSLISENVNEDYYRDYAFALIKVGNVLEARNVVNHMKNNYPQNNSVMLIEAELNFYENNYSEVIRCIDQCIVSLSDSDDLYNAYMIKGNTYKEMKEYELSLEAYKSALALDENINSLRKTGNAYLAFADSKLYNSQSPILSAKDCFLTIYEDYYPTVDDVINLAQSYRLLGDNSKCISLLNEYINSNYVQDFRLYMHLAIASHELNAPETAVYCEKAHNIFIESTEDEKSSVSRNDIQILRDLYRMYCKAAW